VRDDDRQRIRDRGQQHRDIQCRGARKKTRKRDAAAISGEERTCITNRRSSIVMQMSSGEVKGRWTGRVQVDEWDNRSSSGLESMLSSQTGDRSLDEVTPERPSIALQADVLPTGHESKYSALRSLSEGKQNTHFHGRLIEIDGIVLMSSPPLICLVTWDLRWMSRERLMLIQTNSNSRGAPSGGGPWALLRQSGKAVLQCMSGL